MGLWPFSRKKEEDAYDNKSAAAGGNWSFLGADMHSHFIPGIDDGAKSMDDSLTLIRAMANMGYRTIITTPHVMVDYYPNTKATIQEGVAKVQAALAANNIRVSIKAAAEYYMDEAFIKLVEEKDLLTIYNNEVLVEFSMMYEPPMLSEVLFRMQSVGYKPIIAHPERYVFFHNSPARYRELKETGCLMQMNMLSLTGYYGKNIKHMAEDLMAKGMYDYCGSDMHHERHAAALKAMTGTKAYGAVLAYPFLNSRLCF
jgi:protein-tyrosine phosphatase